MQRSQMRNANLRHECPYDAKISRDLLWLKPRHRLVTDEARFHPGMRIQAAQRQQARTQSTTRGVLGRHLRVISAG